MWCSTPKRLGTRDSWNRGRSSSLAVPQLSLTSRAGPGALGLCGLNREAPGPPEARQVAPQGDMFRWPCVKNAYPKWNPGKWNQRLNKTRGALVIVF